MVGVYSGKDYECLVKAVQCISKLHRKSRLVARLRFVMLPRILKTKTKEMHKDSIPGERNPADKIQF